MGSDDKKDRQALHEEEAIEIAEWIESLDSVLKEKGPVRVRNLINELQTYAHQKGVRLPYSANTPYINTIPTNEQPPYPGNDDLECRIRSLIRWNAMAMVVRGNRVSEGIGGHISTFASAAMLYEVAFNHFFRGRGKGADRDLVFFQGHAAPGVYSRAFLEGRLSLSQLENFRHELADGGGLSSYPHPYLMPDFWEFPTVSMGLGPIMAIYQARFMRYLQDRGLKPKNTGKVWAFLGDGETDEPESLGAITLASREKLDNLIFVINCNLQRLDGPVRGNGKIIQELEAAFRGAGWNVIKVIWGSDWDSLLAQDDKGLLVRRMGEVVDGEYQKYSVEPGSYTREHFFGKHPELTEMVAHLSDLQIRKLKRGGHDAEKIYAAYKAAMEHKGSPTVILAKTVKGYGLGEAGEGKNITHQQKKLNEDELREFRTRYGIPISDEEVNKAPIYKPAEDSPEMKYLKERRESLGGPLPSREFQVQPMAALEDEFMDEFRQGTDDREVSTTMAFVRFLAKLLKHKDLGKYVVPIVPDEARTFGMEALFRQCGIYSHPGQLYEPVDSDSLLYYKEATDGQILEEGITEAGAMSSFIAAGTSYAAHEVNMIPFFVYYSMFGFQRIGDLIWAAGDMRCKGFLLGATAGRTTLNGEGLQHQDGHSHLLALPVPNLMAYDPAFAFEIAVIVREGMRRMYEKGEDIFYYLTLCNENYAMPAMPKGVEDGILKGLYCYQKSTLKKPKARVNVMASGPIMMQALKAQKVLEEKYKIAITIYSATSYKELQRDGNEVERWNRLNPTDKPKIPYITSCLTGKQDLTLAVSDYVKTLPNSVSRWILGDFVALGTDGFGRSETREKLRDFFEIDDRHISYAILAELYRQGKVDEGVLKKAVKDLNIDKEKVSPVTA